MSPKELMDILNKVIAKSESVFVLTHAAGEKSCPLPCGKTALSISMFMILPAKTFSLQNLIFQHCYLFSAILT